MGQHPVAISQLNPVKITGQCFHHPAIYFDGVFPGHVKISGSASVIKTVCSKWADSEPSTVTTVQPSFNLFVSAAPAFTMGSIANVIPGFKTGERLANLGST